MIRRILFALAACSLLAFIHEAGPGVPAHGAGYDGEGAAEVAFITAEGAVISGTEISVAAGARGTWAVSWRAGPHGMATGGGVEIKRRGQWDFRLGTVKQTENPQGEDWVTVHCSLADASVEISRLGSYFKDQHEATVRLTKGTLREGDRIVVAVGNRSQGGPGTVVVPDAHDRRALRITSDVDGDGSFALLAADLRVSVAAGTAVRFEVAAPSTVTAGEAFDLLVRAEDHNSNLDRTFRETVRIECTDAGATFTPTAAFAPADGGVIRARIRASNPGFQRFKVSCVPRHRPATGVPMPPIPVLGISNAVKVQGGEPGYRLYWGDLHVHTFESDGTDTPDENYRYAREVAGLDFCAVTDHLFPGEGGPALDGALAWQIENGFHPPVTVSEWWKGVLESADRYYEPGRFVTFYGYEWSGPPDAGGDHNVLLTEPGPLIFANELNHLYAELCAKDRGDNLLINPHVGGRIGNWARHDPAVEPVAEICSAHGHFEWFAQEALGRGYRVGFIGAGDTHSGRPGNTIWQRFGRMGLGNEKGGSRKRLYTVPGGLVGVYASELTREGILSAIRARRCYATTGRRIHLEFTSDNHVMGEAYATDAPPRLSWKVVGTAPLERVDLIRSQNRIHTQWAERRMLLEGGFEDRNRRQGANAYYLRVTQEDGELAWSSPIWVDAATASAAPESAVEPAWNDDGNREQILARSAGRRGPDYTVEALGHLEAQAPGRFVDLVQDRVVSNVRGRYAVLLGYDADSAMTPVRVRYYPDFTEERFHIYPGWSDYGPLRK